MAILSHSNWHDHVHEIEHKNGDDVSKSKSYPQLHNSEQIYQLYLL